MYLCYIDESGTSSVPGNTSHFVLAGIALPIWHWRDADAEISAILSRYGLEGKELHTAWVLRSYLEQTLIPNFETLDWAARKSAVRAKRTQHLLDLQRRQRGKTYRQTKKNYQHSAPYIHLTREERRTLIREVADCVGGWGFARLYAECIDKIHFDAPRARRSIDEQAFEQIVSRFERFLENVDRSSESGHRSYGLLVHDNNETVARKHTELMRHFHRKGTFWIDVRHIIETPLFVDSKLTSMVQIADLCSYALRRYIENGETDLFDRIYARADRFRDHVVGVRHFTDSSCTCLICDPSAR